MADNAENRNIYSVLLQLLVVRFRCLGVARTSTRHDRVFPVRLGSFQAFARSHQGVKLAH